MNITELHESQDHEIIIVDDDRNYLLLLSEILKTEGFTVRSFDNGESALQGIKGTLPSLILLDINIPDIGGFEVCRQLKADENTSNIPVIFISSSMDNISMLTGFRVGGVDFISKPFRKEEILARVKTHISLYQLQSDLKTKNEILQDEINKRKLADLAIEKRMFALTKPLNSQVPIDISELFSLDELQKLQDLFADAFGVASIITQPDGTPITRASNFSRLCQNIIRCTDKGLKNCMHSDAVLGSHHPEGPIVQPCLSGGLWDAGASITLEGQHVASWLIGQVRNEAQKEAKLVEYAREIGANENEFMEAFKEIPSMSHYQFQKVAEMLFTVAGQLSEMAYQNLQQARFINERKLAEAALLESEQRFRTTLYSIGDGVITTDVAGKVLIMNLIAEDLTGWSQLEAKGKPLEEIFPIINEETRTSVEIPVRRVLREGVIVGLANHTLLIAKDGTERPIADSGAPIRNEKGEIVGVILVFRDQTDERCAEQALIESEKRFRLLYENAPLSYQSLNPQAKLIDVNPTWLRTMGYSERDEVIGHHFGEFMTAESAELIKNRFADFVTAGEIHNYEFDMVRKDGTIITVSYEGKIGYDEFGQFKQTHCIFTDITEQRRAELALKESEERFRKAICEAPFPIMIHAEDDEIIAISRGWTEMSGYEISDIPTTQKWTKLAYGNEQETVKSYIDSLYGLDHWVNEGEYEIQAKCGEKRIWDFSSSPLGKLADERRLVISMAKDVTERKQFEIKLQRSEQELKKAQQITHIGSWYLNLADNEVFWSEELYKMYGFDPNLPVPPFIEHKKLFTPESWELLSDSLANTAKTGIPYELELKTVREDGSNGWMWVLGETVKDAAGKTMGLWGAAQDISARKHAEQLLQKSEYQYRSLFDQASDGIFIADSVGNYIDVNLYGCIMLGYSREEILKLNIKDIIEREDEASNPIKYKEMCDEHVATAERLLVCKNGNLLPVEISGKMLDDGRFQGIVRDISERKQAERAILEANQKMDAFFNQSLDGFFFMMLDEPIEWNEQADKDLLLEYAFSHQRITKVNDAWLDQFGATREQFIGMTPADMFRHDIETGKKEWRKLFDQGKLHTENSGLKFTGELIYVEGDYTCLYNQEGRITGHFGIQRDITESIRNLETIKNEQQLLRTLIDNLPVTIYVKDSYGRKLVTNKADLEVIGKETEAEVLGKTDLETFSDEIGQRGYQDDLKIIQSQEPVINLEEVFIDKNGSQRWLLTSKVPIIDQQGKTTGIVGIGRDITEQKKSELQIQKLTESIEQSPSTIVITDVSGTIEYVNPKFSEITGYTKEEAIGQNPRILKSGEMSGEVYQQLWDTISSGKVWRGEFLNRKKNGELYWEWATITSIKNAPGVITNYIALKNLI